MSKQHHDDGPIITIKDNNQNAAQHNPYSSTHNQVGLPDFTLQAHPIHVDCPHCHHSGMTKVEAKIGMLQWLLCLFLCLVGCYCCCWRKIDLKDATHTCASCNQYLGRSMDPKKK